MFNRMARSWTLVKASAQVLRADKELVVFPIISLLALLVVLFSFAAPFWVLGGFESLETGQREPLHYALIFLFYLVQYFVIFYFNTALVGATMIRLQGGDPTVDDGLRIANERLLTIFGFALLSATVGMVLRWISERSGLLGRLVAGLFGVAWSLATYLVVPVIVVEKTGPVDAVKRSAGLLKQTWGEQIVGNFSIGAIFMLPMLLLIFLGIGAGMLLAGGQTVLGLTLLALCIIAIGVLAIVQSTLSGIYTAAVYRYAATGQTSGPFDAELVRGAFRHK